MKLSVENVYTDPEAPKPEREAPQRTMKVAREAFDVDSSEKPKGQIGKLTASLVNEATGADFSENKVYEIAKDGAEEKMAKTTMKERGMYLEKYDPESFHKVLEIRGRARKIKDLMEQAEKTDDPILRLSVRNKARAIGDYSELIREAVDLFNTSYADIEDKAKEDREAKAHREAEDAKKIAEAREKIAWLHSPKNPANYFINKEKKTRLDKIQDDREERLEQDRKERENNTVSQKMGRGNHRDSTNIVKPIPGSSMEGKSWSDPKKHVNINSGKYPPQGGGLGGFFKKLFGNWRI